MSQVLSAHATEAAAAVTKLFANQPPILVEVRFPRAATSPDWYLFQEEGELEGLLEGLAPGTEVHLSSVWELGKAKGEVCLKV